MAYASVSDLLDRYDARVIGDLVSDDNTQVAAADLESNSKLQSMLDDASGDIEAALNTGERYSQQDLASLSPHSQSHLVRITCDVAMSLLLRRRVNLDPEKAKAQIELAETHLERLRKGIDVFGLEVHKAAGLIDEAGPSTVDISNLNLLTSRVKNTFPVRNRPFNR